ncbi:MAG: tryptophan synthase subunit alpha [Gammaproteobacteria bacterium]|nr:tryptophan synthase subunit alpha [Gammaproteobacteria bacterium]
MNAFKTVFHDRKAFIAYITAGHGGMDYTEAAARALVAGGVDILEIGLPFSDPMADGPTIQLAMQETLKTPVRFDAVLKMIERIKKQTKTPIVLFSYLNPLLKIGLNQALKAASYAGVDGLLVVDLPLEASNDYFKACARYQLQPIGLVAPSTPAERIKRISQTTNAFLYYVCRNGTTGMKNALPSDYSEKICQIKSLTDIPVVSGFGIGSKALAAEALQPADGFVVGSRFVHAISSGASPCDLKQLAHQIDPR